MKLPFGYEMKRGEIVANDNAAIVTEVFALYIAGSSLLKIANTLTERKTHYAPDCCEWNKSRVKRVLEDERYIGSDDYPKIIEKETFDKAQKQKEAKKTYKPSTEPKTIKLMESKLFCLECGSALKRNRDKYSCNCGVSLTKDEYKYLLIMLVDRIKQTPEVFDSLTAEAISMDIIKLTNRINKAISDNANGKDDIKKMILHLAEQKYYEAAKTASPVPAMLKERFLSMTTGELMDTDLLHRLTKSVHTAKDKSLTVKLSNSNIIEVSNAK